jgi:hypothetical protein
MRQFVNLGGTVGRVVPLAVMAGVWLANSASAAEPACVQKFDGPDTHWRLLDTAVAAQLVIQEYVPGGDRNGSGVERIVVAAGAGQSALVFCPTAPAAVIEELEARIWVKADRPAIQLAARVAMPRTRGADGMPASTIVRGEKYDRPGRWQQLALRNAPKLLAEQVRIMRSTSKIPIDPREAFVNAAVLVIPGDPQGVEVFTDELIVDGILRTENNSVQLASFPQNRFTAPQRAAAQPGGSLVDARLLPELPISTPLAKPSPARLQGTTLLVDDKPFLPRVIRWRGEPLQFLAERGFNVVRLDQPPTAEQIAAATRHNLWFICAPPQPDALVRDGLGESGDRVIGWWLEDDALEADTNYAARWAELVREKDKTNGRPVIIAPEVEWKAVGEIADILVARHARLASMDSTRFDQWLSNRESLSRPGTPLWASFATQFDEAVGRQVSALAGVSLPPPSVNVGHLESLVEIGCTHGLRGFVFDSHTSLSEPDAYSRRRAAALERINRRLQLMEPWLAGGKVIGRVKSADGAWTGVMLHVDRARLLIPIADKAASSNPSETVFVVPGVPESSQVFELSPAALRTLPLRRVAGGTRVVMRPDDNAYLLMTEDPQVLQGLRHRIAREGAQCVRVQRDLAALNITCLGDSVRRLAQLGHRTDAAAQAMTGVYAQLRQVDALLAAGRIEQAMQLANSANRVLEQAAIEQRRQIFPNAALRSNPLASGDGQVAECATFLIKLAALRGGENLLYGGDFEDLGQMTQFGWRHFRGALAGIDSRVELSADGAQHGRYCLQLHASRNSAGEPPAVTAAPVWIQSPPMPVPAGQVVEITGWVRADAPIVEGDGGLQIIDSLGGPELALGVDETSGWEPFQMIRAAPESSELRLTFALCGLGSARLDALMVRALEPPTPRRLPPAATTDDATRTTVTDTGPLFIAPQSP